MIKEALDKRFGGPWHVARAVLLYWTADCNMPQPVAHPWCMGGSLCELCLTAGPHTVCVQACGGGPRLCV